MEIWTDGTVTVLACPHTRELRVLCDGAVTAETPTAHPLRWTTPLAVDPTADRVWVGRTVEEFRLSDLTPVTTHPDRVVRLAAVGDGRLAAVLPAVDGACRLAVGRPGRWERQVVLDDLGAAKSGIAATWTAPSSRAIIGDPTLTITDQGIVVADGRAGVVAHFTTGLDLVGVWHSGGADETELIGYATANGILVTGRWAARHSVVGMLWPAGGDILLEAYSAHAVPAGDDRFWLYDGGHPRTVRLLTRYGDPILTTDGPRTFVQAAAASGTTFVLGGTVAVHTYTASDDAITARTSRVSGVRTLIGAFQAGVDKDAASSFMMQHVTAHTTTNSLSSGTKDGVWRITVDQVLPGSLEHMERVLRDAGAVDVTVKQPTV